MQDHPRRDQLIAAALAALAGYVDAVGFIASGGLFVSFMSGNSTRLGIGLADASHLEQLRQWLSDAPYGELLALQHDIAAR